MDGGHIHGNFSPAYPDFSGSEPARVRFYWLAEGLTLTLSGFC